MADLELLPHRPSSDWLFSELLKDSPVLAVTPSNVRPGPHPLDYICLHFPGVPLSTDDVSFMQGWQVFPRQQGLLMLVHKLPYCFV